MAERLNNIIRALESGQHALTCFAPAEISSAIAMSASKYDACVFEMEHNPWDSGRLRDCLQYMLNRAQIAKAGLVPPVMSLSAWRQTLGSKPLMYTVLVTVDDRSVEKKDRTVAEPVQFLVRGSRTPYEMVVMEVSKDRITGYLSTPKEMASAAAPGGAGVAPLPGSVSFQASPSRTPSTWRCVEPSHL